MNWANRLTVLRIILSLAVFLALMRPGTGLHLAAFALFLAAIVTDYVDGEIARRWGAVSAFGKVADPIADKILVIGALIALARMGELHIPLWAVFLIVIRELLIGGVRILASAQGRIPEAQPWGKWKMGVQSAAVLIILAILVLHEIFPLLPPWIIQAPYYLTVFCALAAWASAYRYFQRSRQMLEKSWR